MHLFATPLLSKLMLTQLMHISIANLQRDHVMFHTRVTAIFPSHCLNRFWLLCDKTALKQGRKHDVNMTTSRRGNTFHVTGSLRVYSIQEVACFMHLKCSKRVAWNVFSDGYSTLLPRHPSQLMIRSPMMTSWHGKAFRFASPLWRKSTGDQWIPFTKVQ